MSKKRYEDGQLHSRYRNVDIRYGKPGRVGWTTENVFGRETKQWKVAHWCVEITHCLCGTRGNAPHYVDREFFHTVDEAKRFIDCIYDKAESQRA